MITIITESVGEMPQRRHHTDAGFDLHASTCMRIPVGAWALVPTGTKMQIPDGYVGKICPRSGLALKHGVTVLNAPGIIDAGFEGEICAILVNHGIEPFDIEAGDRIAQLLIEQLPDVQLVQGKVAAQSERGERGFGSTGKR